MNWRNYRWPVVGLTLLITLALLFGGQFLWQQFAIAQPMSQIAQGIDGVESVSLDKAGKNKSMIKVNVKLNQVANLQTTYQALDERIANVLGHHQYEIILHSSSAPELERLYYSIHYDIQEAIFTGNFSLMAERIQTRAEADKIAARTFVDASHVYLQLTNPSGSLYIAVPRNPKEVR